MTMKLATAVPVAAPAKFRRAAIPMAALGERTRVPITVAIALAASLKPFARPKPTARMMRIIKTAREPSGTLDHYPFKHIGDILALVDGALYMFIDLSPFDDLGNICVMFK